MKASPGNLQGIHLFWLNLIFWPLLILLNILQYYGLYLHSESGFPWQGFLARWVPGYVPFMLLGVPVYYWFRFSRKFPPAKKWGWLLLGGLVISFLHLLFFFPLFVLIRPEMWKEGVSFFAFMAEEFRYNYPLALGNLLFYGLMVLVLEGVQTYQRFQEEQGRRLRLENSLQEAELSALKMQVQPHFLFNAFHTVSMQVVQQKNEKAVEMLASLSELLRTSMRKEKADFIPLEQELAFAKSYLSIEEVRFADRLKVEWDIAPSVQKANVPVLFLQPLLENAFKHGIARQMGNCLLRLSIFEKENQLWVQLFNSGPFLPEGWKLEEHTGIGLKNTQSRFDLLFGKAYYLELSNQQTPAGVLLSLRFPFTETMPKA